MPDMDELERILFEFGQDCWADCCGRKDEKISWEEAKRTEIGMVEDVHKLAAVVVNLVRDYGSQN